MLRMHQAIGSGIVFVAAVAWAGAAHQGAVQTKQLQPYTHVARILAGSDVSSIRFQSLKAVKVDGAVRTDNRYCEDQFRDPGGSIYCPMTTYGSPEPAYRVTYSYTGQPMASDEYGSGNTRYTFSVMFRPEELSAAMRGNPAEHFAIHTSREMIPEKAVDEAKSKFCEGYYHDGLWTPRDRSCLTTLVYKTVMIPSPYITVTVVPSAAEVASLGHGRK